MGGLIDEAGGLADNGVFAPNVQLSALTYATLPSSPVAGTIAYITDANASTGNVTAGGSSNKVLVWYNGTNWRVVMN